ncbi:hypothetical protein ACE6ED_25395 [Paenibacillus sp. CN-4]|uniref:hypothetical protein n=1 Tax=Paenibacillus nanchangensis TaxID=3348343 RepID=UPI00397D9D27
MSKDFDELMEEAYLLPDGRAKIEKLEEAARIADMEGDVDRGYEARAEIVESAVFNGYPKKALVAFSWQLGQFDKEPDRFDDYSLLWSYKWILDKIACFPEISREQIDALLEDMKKRYSEYGYNDRTYYYYKIEISMLFGEREEAARLMKQVEGMERDGMSDCAACEQDRLVDFHVFTGDDEGAVRAAGPILNGRMSCGEVPHVTLSKVLMPFYRLGQLKEAKNAQKKGYRLIKDNRDFLIQFGEHIRYLTEVDPFKGLELFEKHVSQALDHENPYDQMMFYAYASGLFARLQGEEVKLQVKLPAAYPHPEDGEDAARMARRLRDMAMVTAEALDRRNGNHYYSEWIGALAV